MSLTSVFLRLAFGVPIVLILGYISLSLFGKAFTDIAAGRGDAANTPEEIQEEVIRGGYGASAVGCHVAGEHSSLGELWRCTVTSKPTEGFPPSEPITLDKCFTATGAMVVESSCSYLEPENGGIPQ